MKENEEFGFVARHYVKGRFSAEKAWRRLDMVKSRNWLRISAAAAGVLIMLSASAYLAYDTYFAGADVQDVETEQQPSAQAIRVIDFEDATLTQVVERIEAVYGVTVTNVPENAQDYKLSLRYEGNVYDLLETINDILSTDLTVIE